MKTNIPEEEKIGSIVSDLEKVFQKLFNQLSKLGQGIIFSIKKLFISWKTLLTWAIIGGLIGASSLLVIPRKYESSLVLKTYINANDQLFSDVNYLNALIETNRMDKLAEILGISTESAEEISLIDITSTATITERLSHLNKVYGKLDSALIFNLNIESLLENDKYTFTNKFKVTIYAKDPTIFEGMEENLISYLERVTELNKTRDNKLAILKMKKKLYVKEIQGLDSLKAILNDVMIEQAKTKESGEMTINMGQSNQNDLMNPLKVYAEVSKYSQKIADIEEQLPLYEKCYFILSHLNQTGQKSGLGGLLRALIGATALGFIGVLSVLFSPIRKP